MTTAASIAERIEILFRRIADTRMRDLPILNPALTVETVGFRAWDGQWLGALITPWSINLILLPAGSNPGSPAVTGTTRTLAFPAGEFEFLAGYDPAIGPYESCSLFSPVTGFEDQRTAVATAQAALAFLFNEQLVDLDESTIESVTTTPARGISRRELLRGRLRAENP